MKNILIGILLFLFTSCVQERGNLNCYTLSVDLKNSSLQYSDVFSGAEVIPLETTDSSLIVYPFEVIEHKGYFYLYDLHLIKAFIFDEKGKFVRQIGNKGQGPREYTWLSSISIDKNRDVIHLIEPVNNYLTYTLDGNFIEQKKYPDDNDYQCFYPFDNYMAAWSIPSSNDSYCIYIFNPETMEVLNKYYRGPALAVSQGFHYYKDNLYYHENMGNNVYQVTKDSLKLVYQWDFGKENFVASDLDLTFKDENKEHEYDLFWKYMKDGTVPYIKVGQAQNDDYNYVCLRYQYKYDKSIFYRKNDGKYLIWGEEDWGIPTNALVFTDDYMIVLLKQNNYNNFKPLLSESEREKLDALSEDDNPCLLKLYFKK